MMYSASIEKLAPIFATLLLGTPHAVTAHPAVEAVTVRNVTGLSSHRLEQVERAVETQSAQLSRYWHTPIVHFVSSGGWPLVIEYGHAVAAQCIITDLGCHSIFNGKPIALVSRSPNWDWPNSFSHEILEAIAKEHGAEIEICDPVSGKEYKVRGIYLSDWVLPDGRDYMKMRGIPW